MNDYRGSSLPILFKRLDPGPLDVDSVFDDLKSAKDYVKGGTAYPGQILTIKINNKWKIFIINDNMEVVEPKYNTSNTTTTTNIDNSELLEALTWQDLNTLEGDD